MAASRKDRCGTRLRRQAPEPDACPLPDRQPVTLTPLGQAMVDALREDPRYREIFADPFGEQGGG